jgi:hypothetical protein
MKWLALTLCLLGASAGLVAWVYLRDRDPASWRVPESQFVRADAAVALRALGGSECGSRCAVAELLGPTQPHRWLVRLTVRGRVQCVQIDPATFGASLQHGLAGVRASRCAPRRGARGSRAG